MEGSISDFKDFLSDFRDVELRFGLPDTLTEAFEGVRLVSCFAELTLELLLVESLLKLLLMTGVDSYIHKIIIKSCYGG